MTRPWWRPRARPASCRPPGPNASIAALLELARRGAGRRRRSGRADLLAERARVLGGAVALLRDMLNPDDLVVGGQAFTEYPEGCADVAAAFAERSLLAPVTSG